MRNRHKKNSRHPTSVPLSLYLSTKRALRRLGVHTLRIDEQSATARQQTAKMNLQKRRSLQCRVRLWLKADIPNAPANVRFWG
jgi:hypothetical protein